MTELNDPSSEAHSDTKPPRQAIVPLLFTVTVDTSPVMPVTDA